MKPIGYKVDSNKIVRKKYNCENCTYKKYGNEIKITDYVNAGRDRTETKKIIGKTVSIEELKRMCKEIPQQKEIVNMNLDPYMANKIMKTSKIAYDKIMEFKKKQEEMKQKQEETKGDNVNE